jgi:DNA-binding NarL/FixJ family response regulator
MASSFRTIGDEMVSGGAGFDAGLSPPSDRRCRECLYRARFDDRQSCDRIVLVGAPSFFRECIRTGLQVAFTPEIEAYDGFEHLPGAGMKDVGLMVVAAQSYSTAAVAEALRDAAAAAPHTAVVFFSLKLEIETARDALSGGARGYIPMTMGFRTAVEAVRFILAGGAYVPPECLFADVAPLGLASARALTGRAESSASGITPREMDVARALRAGKQNKIIAYEIGCSETTVKVHLRSLMRKLGARNRTEVAIKAAELEVGKLASSIANSTLVTI